MTREDIEIVYNHIFENKYLLDGQIRNFYPNYHMSSRSLQRLIEGKVEDILEIDIIMLQHERLEYHYMNSYKMLYEEAHNKTNLKYNYEILLKNP